ncbi:hypothetical protein [Streptomyces sp. NBC_00045]|uniref:hypothetical protein n=1 Tax=Streptomyces sp. NBC_00045 TaxID=2975625 RepID=UPI0032503804
MNEKTDQQPPAGSPLPAAVRAGARMRHWLRALSDTDRARPADGGPLRPYELEAARRAGVPATRLDLFAHFLGEDGLRTLWSLLDSGRYEVTLPEEAALLTVAWLVRAGDDDAAEELVAQLRPFADRLPLTPRPADVPAPPADAVRRRSAAEASIALGLRKPNPAVEAQREALSVWRPFEDELLAHRLRADSEGHGAQWRADGAALLERYADLAARHTRCTGHLDPKSNPAILRRALAEAVAGRPADPRLAGLLRHAVTSMVAKRGRPGSPEHTRLREVQAAQAARPAHHELAALARHRLCAPDADRAAPGAGRLEGPVTAEEAARTSLPAGTALPPAVRALLAGIRPTDVTALLAQAAVPSAEVLAELVPQLATTHTARGYADEPLRTLLAATHRSGAARSTVNHWWTPARHARTGTAPWVRAVAAHGPDPVAQARLTLRAVGELAVEAFPGAGIPDRLVGTLSSLAQLAQLPVRFLSMPLANSFSGAVNPDLYPAVHNAADLLRGTPYERYYGIDYAALRERAAAQDAVALMDLCAGRAGLPQHRRTGQGGRRDTPLAHDAAVQEQARVLTTFNMATLVREVGIEPSSGWDGLARGAFTAARRRSATPKRTACAWRQLVFHLSLCGADEQAAVLVWIDAELARLPQAAARLAPALARLRLAATSSGTRPSPRACRP